MDEIGEDFVDKNWSGQHAMNINKYLYIYFLLLHIYYIYIHIYLYNDLHYLFVQLSL